MKRFALALTIALIGWVGWVRGQDSTPDADTVPHHRTLTPEELKAQRLQRAEDEWSKLTPDAKIRLMRLHDALVLMPVEERRLIHQQAERYLNMTAAEREQLKKNLERWSNMTPEERAHAREVYQQRRRELEGKNSSTNTPPPATQLPPP
jgi:hypothetical protein